MTVLLRSAAGIVRDESKQYLDQHIVVFVLVTVGYARKTLGSVQIGDLQSTPNDMENSQSTVVVHTATVVDMSFTCEEFVA